MYSECIYKHKEQIFGLSPCPYDPTLCFVVVGCDSGLYMLIILFIDTKKGVLYKLENLPLTNQPEEKGVEPAQEVEQEEIREEEPVPESAEEKPEETAPAEPAEPSELAGPQPESEQKPEEEGDQKEQPAPELKEGEDKPENEEMEVTAEPAEESLPDDKKDEVIESKPTELVELAVLPRENIIR